MPFLDPLVDRADRKPVGRVFIHHPGTHDPFTYCVETRTPEDTAFMLDMIKLAQRLERKAWMNARIKTQQEQQIQGA